MLILNCCLFLLGWLKLPVSEIGALQTVLVLQTIQGYEQVTVSHNFYIQFPPTLVHSINSSKAQFQYFTRVQ